MTILALTALVCQFSQHVLCFLEQKASVYAQNTLMAWGLYHIHVHAAGLQDAGPCFDINLCIAGFGASALLKGLLSFLL